MMAKLSLFRQVKSDDLAIVTFAQLKRYLKCKCKRKLNKHTLFQIKIQFLAHDVFGHVKERQMGQIKLPLASEFISARRQSDRQTDRETDRQIHTYPCVTDLADFSFRQEEKTVTEVGSEFTAVKI